MLSNTETMTTAIEEAGLGVDNDYVMKMKERDLKRQEILKYKEVRRKENIQQRLSDALIAKRKLEKMVCEDKRVRELSQENADFDEEMRTTFKRRPLLKLDSNARLGPYKPIETQRVFEIPKRFIKHEDFENNEAMDTTPKRQPFAEINGVIIDNLSPQSNEYSISAICQTVGEVKSCSIELVNGRRRGKTYFVNPSDAHQFCERFNNFKLDASLIQTRLF